MMKNLSDRQATNRTAALELLHQRIRSCRLCQEQGYIPIAHPIVSGRTSDCLFVIGQAPGHRSVAQDRPFSGPGGRILQRWLEQAGFPPGYLHEHTYLSSLTHCDPGRNPRGGGDRRPSPQEIALCRPFLEAELRLVQPRVVLLVGKMAIEAFLLQSPQNGEKKAEQSTSLRTPSQRSTVYQRDQQRSSDFALGKCRLEDMIGTYTYREHEEMFFLPLPHPSGVSRWLNDPEHQKLLRQALSILAQWRETYAL
jgi:uracil-DNA glycosylase family 4